jgi:hypothetical protein
MQNLPQGVALYSNSPDKAIASSHEALDAIKSSTSNSNDRPVFEATKVI